MASTKFGGRIYTQVDTTIPADVTAKIEQLNGRQGDNMRPAYLQLVRSDDGVVSPWNLSGCKVELGGKDYSGKVKLTNTATIMNAAKGMITLQIPAAFYQTVGDYQQAYLRILKDNQVVSTVNVALTVFESGLAISTGDSVTYLGGIQAQVDQAQARINPLNTQVNAIQGTLDAVQGAAKGYLQQIQSNAVARTNSGNEFQEWNTFDKGITVKGNLEANGIAQNYGAWRQITNYVDGKFSMSPLNGSGITLQDGNYTWGDGITSAHGKIGPINVMFVMGQLRIKKSLARWDGTRLFTLEELRGVQKVWLLNPIQKADGQWTLWLQMDGNTMTARNISDIKTNPDYAINFSQVFMWM